jgi:hypothetical protein
MIHDGADSLANAIRFARALNPPGLERLQIFNQVGFLFRRKP